MTDDQNKFNNQNILANNLLAEIDACRPDTNDHLASEFSQLAEFIQHDQQVRNIYDQTMSIDRELIKTFQASEPTVEAAADGLADRILQQLLQQPEATNEDVPAEPSPTPATVSRKTATQPLQRSRQHWISGRRVSGRRVFAGLSLTAMVVAVLLTIALWPQPPSNLTANSAAAMAITYHSQHLDDRHQNYSAAHFRELLPEQPTLEKFIPPRSIVYNNRTRWRRVAGLFSSTGTPSAGIAWDLESTDGEAITATLYVIEKKVDGWPDVIGDAKLPQANTGGKTAWAWSQDGFVYLLVIDGQQQDYHKFVNPSDNLAFYRFVITFTNIAG